jgi:NAD(P)-dependent dehydrogenase (short-subunit alcohol dehydrogenase family)
MDPQAQPSHTLISVVSGATDGIGRVVAFRLASAGHHVVALARSPDKARSLCSELTAATGAPADWVHCDLAALASVRQAAAEVAARFPRIDTLVNNAALFAGRIEETADGFEKQLGVNYLAPFLFTHLLLPNLQAAGPARIVNVSGETARFARIVVGDPERMRRLRPLGAYGQSKLAQILFTFSLAERLAGSQVTVNALHPGPAATGHVSAGPRWLDWFWRAISPRPERAAGAVARLVLRPDLAGVSGRYYIGRLRGPAPFSAYRRKLRESLYATTRTMVGLPPEREGAHPL